VNLIINNGKLLWNCLRGTNLYRSSCRARERFGIQLSGEVLGRIEIFLA